MQVEWWVWITFVGLYVFTVVALIYKLEETRKQVVVGEDKIRDMEVKIEELEEYVKTQNFSKKSEIDKLPDSK